jgi:Bifunctional DNA primase/polymerase, N-terminal/AAA domain
VAAPDKPDGRLRGSAGGHQADATVEDDPNIFSPPDLGERNLTIALGYVAEGWPILQLALGTKRPSAGSLGVYGATTDPAEVERLWLATPDANIAGATGHGFMAFDVDPAEGAAETLAALPPLPPTRRHRTPHGRHLVFRAPIGTRGAKLGPGVTVRGVGSYVVLPGSTLVDGGTYQVLDDHPAAEAPVWLLERLANHTPQEGAHLVAEIDVDAAVLPRHLRAIMAEDPGVDRSGQVWELVAAALEWGLHDGEVLFLARRFTPAVAKYLERLDEEIGRALAKGRDQHQHPGQPCDRAGCPNTPEWMGGSPKTPANRFRAGVLSFGQVLARPVPVYLVDGLVVVHTIAVLFGRSTVGKSFVALDWALTSATEGDWLGRRVESGPVLYVASEGADGLGPRLRAWSQEHGGLVPADGAFEVYPLPVNLRDRTEVGELVAYVAERRFLLTVVDTLNRSIGGGNENAPDVMGPAFEAADQVRRAHDYSTPLVIHHANDEGRVRGHKSWEGNAQTIISARSSGGVLSLSTDPEHGGKQKDGPPVRLELELRPVALEDGDTSCVVRPSSLVKATLAELAAGLSHKSAFLTLLQQRAAVGSAVTGEEAAKLCEARGIAERTFRDLVSALVNDATVQKEGRGQAAIYTLVDP